MKALAWIAGMGLCLGIVFLAVAYHTAGDSFSFANQLVGQNPTAIGKGFREWAWSGGDKLTTDVPATIQVTPGNPPAVIVHGENDMLRHLLFGDGKLVVADQLRGKLKDKDMDMDMRGVSLNEIDVIGTGVVNLRHLSQDKLTINVSGAGRLTADGHVGDMELKVSGAGRADLAKLSADNVKAELDDAGRANIAPVNSADITVRSVGRVRLATKPKTLTSNVMGYGRITGPDDDDQTPAPPVPPSPPR